MLNPVFKENSYAARLDTVSQWSINFLRQKNKLVTIEWSSSHVCDDFKYAIVDPVIIFQNLDRLMYTIFLHVDLEMLVPTYVKTQKCKKNLLHLFAAMHLEQMTVKQPKFTQIPILQSRQILCHQKATI